MRRWGMCIVAGLLVLGLAPDGASAQDTIPATDTTAAGQLPELVVQADRLAVGGIPLDRFPMAAEVRRYETLTPSGAWSVADLTQGMVGVSFGDQFGSPFQPDLRFRGFQVGPVVGYPQSVSVFVDGVRVNEPDASQVNFNLIPLQAIERVEVIRGPGGPFGRNTLAGAINFVTRSGSSGRARGAFEGSGGTVGFLGHRWQSTQRGHDHGYQVDCSFHFTLRSTWGMLMLVGAETLVTPSSGVP